MARKPQVTVEPRPNGWAVQTDGTKRADSLHATQQGAVARGRELAANKQAELVIKDKSGKVVGKDSHGKRSAAHQGLNRPKATTDGMFFVS